MRFSLLLCIVLILVGCGSSNRKQGERDISTQAPAECFVTDDYTDCVTVHGNDLASSWGCRGCLTPGGLERTTAQRYCSGNMYKTPSGLAYWRKHHCVRVMAPLRLSLKQLTPNFFRAMLSFEEWLTW